MGLDKMLGDLLGKAGGGNEVVGALAPMVGTLLAGGGLQKVLAGFQANGFGSQADSWVGTGANEPVSGQQVRNVVGEDEIAQIAQKLGVSPDRAADALADVLPQVVDRVTPEGKLPPQQELDSVLAQLQQVVTKA
jgi:uncharacterized protein YidB (DUF937 family)